MTPHNQQTIAEQHASMLESCTKYKLPVNESLTPAAKSHVTD